MVDRGKFLHQGRFGQVWGQLRLSQLVGGGTTGMWWERPGSGETAEHPPVNSQPSVAKNYLAHSASGIEVEKACSTARIFGKNEKE